MDAKMKEMMIEALEAMLYFQRTDSLMKALHEVGGCTLDEEFHFNTVTFCESCPLVAFVPGVGKVCPWLDHYNLVCRIPPQPSYWKSHTTVAERMHAAIQTIALIKSLP
jgi:hypothetical protein